MVAEREGALPPMCSSYHIGVSPPPWSSVLGKRLVETIVIDDVHHTVPRVRHIPIVTPQVTRLTNKRVVINLQFVKKSIECVKTEILCNLPDSACLLCSKTVWQNVCDVQKPMSWSCQLQLWWVELGGGGGGGGWWSRVICYFSRVSLSDAQKLLLSTVHHHCVSVQEKTSACAMHLSKPSCLCHPGLVNDLTNWLFHKSTAAENSMLISSYKL